MKIEAVLFDLDGTLLNTLGDLTDSVNYAMGYMGYPLHTEEEVRTYINNGARHLITAACPKGTPAPEIDACLAVFQAHYREHLAVRTVPYPGIMELLAELKSRGLRTAVVSNKFMTAVQDLSKRYFGELMDAAVGEQEANGLRRKPWPDTVFEALRLLGVPGDRALYVGDTEIDLKTARNAGLPCLCVSWGFKSREALEDAGAEQIADDTRELLSMMENMQK